MRAKLPQQLSRLEVPAVFHREIDNPNLDWNPFTNKVTVAEAGTVEAGAPADKSKEASDAREPDTRFDQVRTHLIANLLRPQRCGSAFSAGCIRRSPLDLA